MTSSSRDIYFHTPSRNQTKLWPVEKHWLESFIMSCLHRFWEIRSVLFCLSLIKSSATDLKCFWPFNCKKLPSVKPKLNSATDVSCLNTGFRIANKECQRNYMFISKKQHWRSPAKKLEEEKTTRLQGWPGKIPRYWKAKTYFNKPSKWLKRVIVIPTWRKLSYPYLLIFAEVKDFLDVYVVEHPSQT